MNEPTIRQATREDLPTIQAIARKTISRSYRSFLGDENVDMFINSGESDKVIINDLERCDVILTNGNITGFTIYYDNLIHLMMVDVDLHRQGLGSLLLSHVEEQLFQRGNTIIRLETFEGNRQAINFYKKNGWKITKKDKDAKEGFERIYFEKHKVD